VELDLDLPATWWFKHGSPQTVRHGREGVFAMVPDVT